MRAHVKGLVVATSETKKKKKKKSCIISGKRNSHVSREAENTRPHYKEVQVIVR